MSRLMQVLLAVMLLIAVSYYFIGGKKVSASQTSEHPVVVMVTSMGTIKIELDPKNAPISTANFLKYVHEGFYNGTIFHRVIPGFMIQGGGFDSKMSQKPTHEPIKNEAGNGLLNEEGTLAMARTGVVDSATGQFFINVKNNTFLNHRDNSPQGYGYAVFGKVISGMDVVHKIENVKTTTTGPFQDVPATTVVIEKVTVENPVRK